LGRKDRLHAENEVSQSDLQLVFRISHSGSLLLLQECAVGISHLPSEHRSPRWYQLHDRPSEGLYQGYLGLSAEQVALQNSVISSSFDINFGQLSLWVRLSCNVDMVEAFKKQCGISSLKDTLYASPVKKDISQKSLPRRRTIIDVTSFKDQQQKDSSVFENSTDQDTQLPLDSSNIYYSYNSDLYIFDQRIREMQFIR